MIKPENKILSYMIMAVILILTFGCHNSYDSYLQAEIDTIAARWIPDSREGICNVKADPDGRDSFILRGETTSPEARNMIIKTLSKDGIKLIDSILILPDTSKNKLYLGLVSSSVINLRKLPDHRSELVSQAILGTPVKILKTENSWLLIQTPDNYISWTDRSSVTMMTSLQMAAWKNSDRLIFIENSGWIYNSANESGVIGDLVAGSIFQRSGETRDFYNISLPDGRSGLVRKKEVMDFDIWRNLDICTGDNVCRVALSFLGLPYLWGGSSPKGVDCSGFVQSVYFNNGVILSRDASLQSKAGAYVDTSNKFSRLRKGDLLFFGSKSDNEPNVTHVAIYIGDSEYIHSSGRVMINSLVSSHLNYSSFRKNSILAVRRIIGTDHDKRINPVSQHRWY